MRLTGIASSARRSDAIVSVAAIVSLALGIGAATAIFSLVNALLLRPLPVTAPERLAAVTTTTAERSYYTEQYSYNTFDEIRRRALFDDVLAWSTSLLTIDGDGQPVSSMWVSGNFFSVLGVPAFLGRAIDPSDDVTGGGRSGVVAMISQRLWQRRYQSDPRIIGRAIRLDRTLTTIVGVTPPGFTGVEVGRAFDLFIPGRLQAAIESAGPLDADAPFLWLVARLRAGQSIDQGAVILRNSQSDIRTASRPARWVGDFLKDPFMLEPAESGTSAYFDLRGRYRGPLFALLVVAALVVAIACANVANLFLARAAARRRELALRAALGASRPRLVLGVLRESAVFAAAGALFGLLFAMWAGRTLVSELAGEAQLAAEVQPLVLALPLDWRVLTFVSIVAAVTVAIFGLAPAFHATRITPIELLKQDGRTGGPARTRALNVFLVGQVAVALLLVLTAGLFSRSFRQVTSVPFGFDPDGFVLGTIAAPTVSIDTRNPHYHRLVDAVTSLPGVARAGGAVGGPLTVFGDPGFPLAIAEARGGSVTGVTSRIVDVTPGWMEAYGMGLLAGRHFTRADVPDSLPVMIVNEAFVRQFFPGEALLDRTFSLTANPGSGAISLGARQVVGIVGDTVHDSVREPAKPTVYQPLAQRTFPLYYPAFFLAVRPRDGSPDVVIREATAALRAVDPALRVSFQSMTERVDAMLTQDRVIASLSAFGGGLALLLAVVGLYGVTAYAVAHRRSELAIRLALGSPPARLVKFVLRQTLQPVVLGLIIGLTAGASTAQLIGSLLYGVTPTDPVVALGAVAILSGAAVVAALVPALRASRVDLSSTLKQA
jgi:putative ABC transport system permease protein